jgi:hypothetical protein
MVDEQSGGGFERRPDVDAAALGALLRRVLGPGLQVARTPAGVAAQVYRVEAAGRVLYARIAEEAHEDLSSTPPCWSTSGTRASMCQRSCTSSRSTRPSAAHC